MAIRDDRLVAGGALRIVTGIQALNVGTPAGIGDNFGKAFSTEPVVVATVRADPPNAAGAITFNTMGLSKAGFNGRVAGPVTDPNRAWIDWIAIGRP